jgi:ElaB/YqjD/DUF883 family membrane-anchored ribosome-binding protein
METTANSSGRHKGNDARGAAHDVNVRVRKLKAAGTKEVEGLFSDVEDLITRIGDSVDPEIAKVRAKIESGLADAKQSIADGAEYAQNQAKAAVSAGGRYVGDNPWQSLGIAALAGLVIGVVIARR